MGEVVLNKMLDCSKSVLHNVLELLENFRVNFNFSLFNRNTGDQKGIIGRGILNPFGFKEVGKVNLIKLTLQKVSIIAI